MNEFYSFFKEIAQQLKKEEIKMLYHFWSEKAVTSQKGITIKEIDDLFDSKLSRFKILSFLSVLTSLCFFKADKSEKEGKYFLSEWGIKFLEFYNEHYSSIFNKKKEA